MWARGLKLQNLTYNEGDTSSRPVWARGLKPAAWTIYLSCDSSRPVWARGLKLTILQVKLSNQEVAPRVGAWIETQLLYALRLCAISRAPCGRVD